MDDCEKDIWYTPFVNPEKLTGAQIVFLMLVYGYALFFASNFISDGSELLLLVPKFAPIVGSVVLPVLGAVPDGMMVFFSGLGNDAQMHVYLGVGALAGSTVMLLTLPLFLAVFSGRVSVVGESLTYKRPANAEPSWDKLQPPGTMHPCKTGVGLGKAIKDNSKLMLLTSSSYFVMQVPSFCMDAQEGQETTAAQLRREAAIENYVAAVGMVMCLVFFFGYLWLMWREGQEPSSAVHDKIATTTVDCLKEGTLTLRGAMAQFREQSMATLCTMGSKDNDLNDVLLNQRTMDDVRRMCRILAPFFALYDVNGDNQIDFNEFCMICKDLHENLSKETQKKMFEAADVDKSGSISFEEFVACLMSFALDPPEAGTSDQQGKQRRTVADTRSYIAVDSDNASNDEDDGEEEEDFPEDLADLDPEEQQRQIRRRAVYKMTVGTFLVLVFSDPMIDLMGAAAKLLDIKPFYVSFVLAPIASNASELVAAYNYAKKRTQKSITTSLSTLVGAGIMNNTFCLGIFFGLVFFKELAWEFSAETISIVVVEFAVAAYTMSRKILWLYDAFIIVSFYVGALILVQFLEGVLHLD